MPSSLHQRTCKHYRFMQCKHGICTPRSSCLLLLLLLLLLLPI
jgi:hypothetical protein